MKFEVIILGKAEKFIDSLPAKFKAKTLWTLNLLQDLGYQLNIPYSKDIKGYDNLKELRVKLGNDINRLFYFSYKSKYYVITSGYIKKSNKLDSKELDRAFVIMNDFIKENKL